MNVPTARRWLSLLVAALVLTALAACAPSAPASSGPGSKEVEAPKSQPAAQAKPLTKVKFQIPVKTADYLPLYMAKEKGIFQAEGLDPEVLVIKGDLAIPALLKGELDYLNVINRTLQSAVLGEPVRVIMGQQTKAGWHFTFGPGVTSAEGMKGKAVGITQKGGTDNQAAAAAVKHLGLNPDKDVTFVVIPSYGDILLGLKNKSIAAGVLLPPESSLAVSEGMKEAVFVGDILEVPYGGLGTTVKRMQENPNEVKAVIRTYIKGMAYVRDHRDEAVQYVMNEFKLDKEVAAAVVADEIKVWSFDGTISEEGFKNQLASWTSTDGPLKNTTMDQLKKATDFSLLKDVQKEMGLTK